MRRSTRSGSIGRSLTTESPGRPWIRRARTTTPAWSSARSGVSKKTTWRIWASSGSRPRPRIAARCWSAGTVSLSSTVSEPPSSVISSASFASGMAGRRGDLTAMPGGFHRARTATTVRACVFADGYRNRVRKAQSADERGRDDVGERASPSRSPGRSPARVGQQEPPNSALVPWVTSVNDAGLCCASVVEQRRDEAGPAAGPALRACWFQSAIIPATSGVGRARAADERDALARALAALDAAWSRRSGSRGSRPRRRTTSGTMRLPELAERLRGLPPRPLLERARAAAAARGRGERRRVGGVVPGARRGDRVVGVERQVRPADGQHPRRGRRPGDLRLLVGGRQLVRRDAARARRGAGVAGGDDGRDAERRGGGELALDQRARRRVGLDDRLALAVGDRDHVRQRRAVASSPAAAGRASAGSPRRRRRRRSRRSGAPTGRSATSAGATIETTIASSELSRIGLIEPALWIFSAVPCVPKQERNVLTSEAGVGASPTIASRAPWPFSPAACSGAIP